MLYLITGQNGAGKSLRAVWLMSQLREKGISIYAAGFRELKLPFVVDFPDPRKWAELPPNSALFVDEAQKVWRTRTAGRPVPRELEAMEEHRHQGIDIYLLTQSPMYLDSHLRPLIKNHEHLISYDAVSARIFRFSECYEDVKSAALRSRAEFEVWKYPTECFDHYKSAEVHLPKSKIPWRQRLSKVLFVLAGLMLAWVAWELYQTFFGEPKANAKPASSASASSLLDGFFPGKSGLGNKGRAVGFANTKQYLDHHRPRVPQMPWSMPALDEREVVAEPELYCMASGEGADSTCSCITEQGTRYRMPAPDCRSMARWGPAYNPFKAKLAPSLAGGYGASSGLGDANGPLRIMHIM